MDRLGVELVPLPTDHRIIGRCLWFVVINCVVQFMADVVLEVLIKSNTVAKVPINWAFLSLVLLSAVTATFSSIDLRKGNVAQQRHELITSILVEALLVLNEVITIEDNKDKYSHIYAYRLPFLIATAINILVLIAVWVHLERTRNHLAEQTAETAYRFQATVSTLHLHARRNGRDREDTNRLWTLAEKLEQRLASMMQKPSLTPRHWIPKTPQTWWGKKRKAGDATDADIEPMDLEGGYVGPDGLPKAEGSSSPATDSQDTNGAGPSLTVPPHSNPTAPPPHDITVQRDTVTVGTDSVSVRTHTVTVSGQTAMAEVEDVIEEAGL